MADDGTAFRALSDAVLALAAEREVGPVLQRLAHAARELGGARYAAIGVPDGDGGFARFITSGMDEALIAAMGPLPRTHGLLGAMLASPEPFRTPDVRADARFRGWWPSAHPEMRSFLGVPIVSHARVTGAVYLTEKLGAPAFSVEDEQAIVLLAAHAAVAIEHAELFERSRELSIAEERNRLARELHDAVVQRLFGVVLAAESAATLLERAGGPEAAAAEVARVRELARGAMDELRAVVYELRPASLEADGLAAVLRRHVEVVRRVSTADVRLRATDAALAPDAAGQVLRIAQEALQNAVRHAGADHIDVRLENGGGRLRLSVADDGRGFEAGAPRGRSLGLTSMEERAAELGGTLRIESAPGAGTRVSLEVPA